MTQNLRSLLVVVFGLALAGCGKATPDTVTPEPVREAPSQPEVTRRALTVSSINLDPNLASGCGITGVETFFEYDSAAVEVSDSAVLAQLTTCLTSGPLQGRHIEIVGHADPRGGDEYNAKLGRSRAQSVQDFMIDRGLGASRIAVSTAGEVGTNPADPAEWPFDRRVDIRLVP